MNSKWKSCLLGDTLTLQRGFDVTKKEQKQGSVPVISSSGVNSYHDTAKVKGPGVILGRKGSLGTVFYVEEDYWPHDTTLWVKDFHSNSPKFTYYFLSTLNLANLDVGASNPTLNRNHVHLLPICWPPLAVQHKIAAILSAYDDLVKNNTRRIAILEEMASMLYQEWFVKFRFPGHEQIRMVESEMGMIPQGWQPVILGDIAQEMRRGINPGAIDPDTPYFGLEHLPQRSIALSEWGIARDVQSTKLSFEKGEILFGKIRPYLHKVGIAPLSGVCSSDTIVICARQKEYFPSILSLVSSDYFITHASKTSQGTQMPRANWNTLAKYPLVLPPEPLLSLFNETITSFVTTIHNSIFRNRNLRRTRDLLLPKLISGEIEVEALDIPIPDVLYPKEPQSLLATDRPEPIDATQLALPLL